MLNLNAGGLFMTVIDSGPRDSKQDRRVFIGRISGGKPRVAGLRDLESGQAQQKRSHR